jgi:hypothetical protein
MMAKKAEPTTARSMPMSHARGALAEAAVLFDGAAKELDQQRAADVERLVHVRVHLRV